MTDGYKMEAYNLAQRDQTMKRRASLRNLKGFVSERLVDLKYTHQSKVGYKEATKEK